MLQARLAGRQGAGTPPAFEVEGSRPFGSIRHPGLHANRLAEVSSRFDACPLVVVHPGEPRQ
jgi:hypothetical protein